MFQSARDSVGARRQFVEREALPNHFLCWALRLP